MKITSIDQLMPFVEQKPEFVVMNKGSFTVIDYVYQDQNTFDLPELMECRGIKFCKDGMILARPFRKFFNYGERGSELPINMPHTVTEKMDGSMVHAILIDQHLYLHTRKGHTDVAKKAERHMMSSQGGYATFCQDAIKAQYTPIFEYTGPNNRIVLRYEEEKLTLLAMRHIISGDLVPRETLRDWAHSHRIPIVQAKNFQLTGQAEDFIAHARGLIDAEGFVVTAGNYMVKIKAEDYVLKHRALDDLGSKKKVVALCVQGFHDDVTAVVGEEDANDLNVFNDAIQQEINDDMKDVAHLVEVYRMIERKHGADARRKFAVEVAPDLDKHLASAVFAMIDGKDARLVVSKHLIRNPDKVLTKWRGE